MTEADAEHGFAFVLFDRSIYALAAFVNHICMVAGCSESEIERITNRVMEYITTGVDRSEP